MSVRILLIIALLLAIAPQTAEAVLFPDLAAQFEQDPYFAGCPKTGAGTGQSQLPAFCTNPSNADAYCSVFKVTKSLESDSGTTRRAYQACEIFYNSALSGQSLFCDYQRDAGQLKSNLSAQTDGISSGVGAMSAEEHAIRCAQKVYGYYSQASLRQGAVLKTFWEQSKRELKRLTDLGAARLKDELSCKSNSGVEYGAPGFLVVGASTVSYSDQEKSYNKLSGSLQQFGLNLGRQQTAARAKNDNITKNATDMSSITQVDGLPSASNHSDITGATQTDSSSGNPALTGAKNMGQSTVKSAASSASEAMESETSVLPAIAEELFASGGSQAASVALSENATGVIVGLGVTYAIAGTVSESDTIGAVFVSGVGVIGATIGAPAIATIAAASAVTVMVDIAKKEYSNYELAILTPYVEFAKQAVQKDSRVTSQAIAQDYLPQRMKMAYCSQCSEFDVAHGCPGMQGAAHGLNPNAQVFTHGSPRSVNPWVSAAYQKSQTAGTGVPFIGAPEVSPVSETGAAQSGQ